MIYERSGKCCEKQKVEQNKKEREAKDRRVVEEDIKFKWSDSGKPL
jgi:hypothetical protein